MNQRSLSQALCVGLVSVVSTAGCVTEPELGSNAGESFEAFKARTYHEPFEGGVYIIGGDQTISSEAKLYEVWSAMQQGTLAVYAKAGADIKWSAAQKLNLTYCISDGFAGNKAAMVTAMREATENGWEKFADVNFKYVATEDGNCTAANPNVLFDINPVNSGGEYLARAFFPDDLRAQRNVLVDGDSFSPTLSIPLKNILAHELGHTLGFRHEHIRPANTPCAEDNQFRGLTAYDAASVMHYPQCNGTSTTLAFTTLDQQGVALLYGAAVTNPSPMAQFTAPAANATVAPNFTVESQIVDTDLIKVELYVDGVLSTTLTAAPFSFPLTGVSVGAHTLVLKAYDSRDQVTTESRTVTVANNNNGGGNGNGTGNGGGNGNSGGGADGADDGSEISGGCATSGSGATWWVGLLLGAVLLRRRRR